MNANRPRVTHDEAFDMLPFPEQKRLRDKYLPSPPGVPPAKLEELAKETKGWLYRHRVAEDHAQTRRRLREERARNKENEE